jgi:cation diffusion facilitator family transporter
MIVLAALVIVAQAVEKLMHKSGVEQIDAGLMLLTIAMIVNGVLGVYLIRTGRSSQSLTLEADGKHLFSDAITSAGVLIALILVRITGRSWIDPIAAIVVSVYIALMAMGLLRRSAAGLMDEQDRADDAKIREILSSHIGLDGKLPHICSFHKLRHRHSGRYHWVDFHIMVPAHWNIAEGHRVASAIEYEIELALGEGNATAHVEPCQSPECSSCAQIAPTTSKPDL